MSSHPLLVIFSGVLYLTAIVISIACGAFGKPALLSIITGGVLWSVGYYVVRAPQMLSLYRSNKLKGLLAIPYLVIFSSVLSAIFYGIGWIISRVIH